jgi:hypothetical protein
MAPMTTFNQRVADHHARISRINRQGRMWQAPRSVGVARVSWTTTVLAPIRQRVGASTDHVADRAAV